MKFTKSQRVLHDKNFNPPSNLYIIDKKIQKNILSGTLAGPVFTNGQKNSFGMNKRFEDIKPNLPGPCQYFVNKKQIVYDFKRDLTNPKTFLKNTFRNQQKNPSIPYKMLSEQNLDGQDKKFLKQLSLIQNPARAAIYTHKKDPSFSFSKSPRKLLQGKSGQKQKKIQNDQYAKETYPRIDSIQEAYYEAGKQKSKLDQVKGQQKKKKLVIYHETIKNASKKRNQIINSINPDYVPSLELIDLMSKMKTKYVPGPGYYQISEIKAFKNELNKISESNNKGSIFSTVKRFKIDKQDILGPGRYNLNYDYLSRKGGLISKQDRKLQNLKNKVDIEHRFYIDPNSSFHSSFNKVQRSSSCINLKRNNGPDEQIQLIGGFGSSSKRFSTDIFNEKNILNKNQQLTQYQIKKRNQFKIQLKAKIKRLNSEDRRSTKQDSGLLGISIMLSAVD